MFKLDLEKARGTRDQIVNTHWIIEKAKQDELWEKKKKETTQEEHPKEKINFIFQEIEEKTEKTIIEN